MEIALIGSGLATAGFLLNKGKYWIEVNVE